VWYIFSRLGFLLSSLFSSIQNYQAVEIHARMHACACAHASLEIKDKLFLSL
jgi:hypothetical protein